MLRNVLVLLLDGNDREIHIPLMSRKLKYALLCFAMLNFTIAGVSNAAAYLDPGTGSIVFQGVIASVATGLAVVATAWKSVANFFTRLLGRNVEKHFDNE
jgi:hypothetical protein